MPAVILQLWYSWVHLNVQIFTDSYYANVCSPNICSITQRRPRFFFFFLNMKFNGKICSYTHTHMHAHEVCQQLQDRGLNVTVCWADWMEIRFPLVFILEDSHTHKQRVMVMCTVWSVQQTSAVHFLTAHAFVCCICYCLCVCVCVFVLGII